MSVYSDMLYKSSPEYVRAYTEGFETMRLIAIEELDKLKEEFKKLQAYSETSGTLEVK
jgi:hypothetical protein